MRCQRQHTWRTMEKSYKKKQHSAAYSPRPDIFHGWVMKKRAILRQRWMKPSAHFSGFRRNFSKTPSSPFDMFYPKRLNVSMNCTKCAESCAEFQRDSPSSTVCFPDCKNPIWSFWPRDLRLEKPPLDSTL